jgi:hypothetical protein
MKVTLPEKRKVCWCGVVWRRLLYVMGGKGEVREENGGVMVWGCVWRRLLYVMGEGNKTEKM